MSDAPMRTPKVVTERGDLRGIALSPTDGFVLSRIDGASDEREIVAVTGLPEERVQASLSKLESLGVIVFEMGRSSAPLPTLPHLVSAPIPGARPDAHALSALEEDVDIDLEIRRQILETHGALDRLDHYALLGVDSRADKKSLRRAYFERAAKFHPDRYFRKKLGSFKPRMEVIFGRLTLAHETVSNDESRTEYDAYLAEQRRARGFEEQLAGAVEEAKRAEESIERELSGNTPVAGHASPILGGSPPPTARPAHSTTPLPAKSATASGPPIVEVAARRDALARRLLGGRGARLPVEAPTSSVSAAPPSTTVAGAMESLRRRYEERVTHAKAAQASTYVAHAEAALAEGNPIAAANAFRIAMSLSPSDAELASKASEAQAKADVVLGETYARQAAYEEKTNQWADAARSWMRTCKVRPNDAEAHERATNAIVKAGGNLHEAGRFAELACTIEPKTARYRVALANVYIAAGLTLNARRELETAAQLAPHDDTIRRLIDKISSKE